MLFPRLFTPLRIGATTLPNRICFLAHRTNLSRNGRLGEPHIAYYKRRARGGCGLITVGEFCIHPGDRPWETLVEAYEDRCVADFRRLTGSIHEFETRVFAQLCHHGFQSSGAISREAVLGPSALSDIAFGETAKVMEKEDMVEVIGAFARAAGLARDGGFDGLEIDMGPESLLRQFLSPLSNHRRDAYGGSTENRMRLPLEVLAAVRGAVGQDFTVGLRLCMDEKFWGAIDLEEGLRLARAFEETGQVDFVNPSVGTYYNRHLFMASMHTPFGFTLDLAAQAKAHLKVPVIASHHIDSPEMAERTLEQGKGDAIGLIRNLICDPDAPQKAREGRPGDIRPCVRDNAGCIGRINRSRTLGCIQNPEAGQETLLNGGPALPRAASAKRVMVVGGGPAGLEAARVARERGHEVVLYEREETLGGQVNLISKGAGRRIMSGVVDSLKRALEGLAVPIVTGVEVTPERVLREGPDAVVLATGSRPLTRPLAGDYGPPFVRNVREVLKEGTPVGERILYVDENGGHHATATVEWLADQGNSVTLVTSELFVGIDLAALGDLYLTRQRLLQKGVTFRPDVAAEEIEGTRVKARAVFTGEAVLFEGFDTVILDMGDRPEDGLYRALKGRVKAGLHRAGDCVAPRGIAMAVLEGRRVGERL